MKKFFKDFGEFIKRGSVVDLAVAMIIGAAFNAIVKSLVNDVIMPVIGLVGGVNVAEASIELVPAVLDGTGAVVTEAVLLKYGMFIQTVIDFLIIAFSVFVIVRLFTRLRDRTASLKKKEEDEVEETVAEEPIVEAVVAGPTIEELLVDIRELLKNK